MLLTFISALKGTYVIKSCNYEKLNMVLLQIKK